MNKIKTIVLGLSAACLVVLPGVTADGQGLVGERYFAVDGGWERFDNDVSDDGWGAGAELNMPFPMDPNTRFGTDLNARFDYKDVLDRDIWQAEAVLRGYQTTAQGFVPFAGAGFGWVDFDDADSTYLPLEVGVDVNLGPVSVVPFFRYSFSFDSSVDDFWSLGAQGVWWLPEGWGLTASFVYTDYDEIAGFDPIDHGFAVRAGLVFAY